MSLPGRLRLRNTTRAMALPEHRSTNWDGRTNGNTSATDSKNSAFCFRIRICEHPREAARLNAAIPGPGTRTSRTIPVAANCSCLRDPAGFRTITTPPPHSVPASAHGVCCAACHSGPPVGQWLCIERFQVPERRMLHRRLMEHGHSRLLRVLNRGPTENLLGSRNPMGPPYPTSAQWPPI